MVNIFEILVVTVLLLSLINPFLKKRIKEAYILIAIVLFIIIDLLFNGYRWQMNLMYVLSVIMILLNSLRLKKPSKKVITKKQNITKIILTIIGILILIVATFLLFLFPIVDLPTPSGEFNVGTTYINFRDNARLETLTENPTDYREFKARIWYPTDVPSNTKPEAYRESYETEGFIDPLALPPTFIFGHYNLVKTNSYLDEPVSDKLESYPILFFSVGFLADNVDYQLFMEELASKGYIVISPSQPYESRSVIKSDGTIIPFSEEHINKYKQHMNITLPFWRRFWTSNDTEERNTISKEILESETFMDNILKIRTKDIQYIVDELEQLGPTSLLYGKLDLENIGIFGHSIGGAVVGQTCLVDNRFKAGINLDGFQWGDVTSGIINQPFMLMYSEPFAYANDYILDNYNNTLYQLVIKGSTHSNFDDNMVVMPITKQIGMLGSIDSDRMQDINNLYIVSFFDKYLKGKDTILFDGASEFTEVEFSIVNE